MGHGLARGLISKFQGGSFKSGFLSGLTSGFDVGTKLGGTGIGGIIERTGIMAIAGGTVSVIGGGKFSNGAFGGAMTHLFNHEIGEAMKTKTQMEQNGRKGLSIGHGKGEKGYYVTDSKGFKYMSDTPEMRQRLDSLKVGMAIPAVVVGSGAVSMGYGYVMINPISSYNFTTAMLDGGWSASAWGITSRAGAAGQAIELFMKGL